MLEIYRGVRILPAMNRSMEALNQISKSIRANRGSTKCVHQKKKRGEGSKLL